MTALIVLLTATAGALNTVQAGANATLSKSLGQPVLVGCLVAAANVVTYLAAAPFLGLAWPGADRFASVPWWGWTGGLLGGLYVLAMVSFADRLGAAVFTAIVVTAGIVTSTLLDHFGLVGFAQHPAGFGRLAGCALMIAGLILVSVY